MQHPRIQADRKRRTVKVAVAAADVQHTQTVMITLQASGIMLATLLALLLISP